MTTRVHNKQQPYDVYCGRPGPYGNRFVIGKDGTREEVITKFRADVVKRPWLVARARQELKDRVLGCWCQDHEACHCDVWIELVDGG
jgi:hypothetical protein